ncbi:MAG: 50S ribosomal protein L24 [Firmicutes bacterium]|jgi:large subunit ribosomal protein L24|nr:50S ribosomal protein L24 [Bacillota bacterium]
MERKRIHVKTGDTVYVLSGKNKGKRGKVLRVIPDKGTVMVEGVNIVKKHQRPTQKVTQGGIIEKEAPIPSSKVMLVCPRCNRPARTGKKLLESGKTARVCKKCGEVI